MANAANGTPICDLLNNVVGLLNELLANPDVLVYLLNELLKKLPTEPVGTTPATAPVENAAGV